MLQKRIKIPCDVNPVPGILSLENHPWYLRVRYAWFLTGFPPFFAIFVELYFVMDSLWKQDFYSLSKYLLVSIIILIVVISMVVCTKYGKNNNIIKPSNVTITDII